MHGRIPDVIAPALHNSRRRTPKGLAVVDRSRISFVEKF